MVSIYVARPGFDFTEEEPIAITMGVWKFLALRLAELHFGTLRSQRWDRRRSKNIRSL